MPGLAAAEWGWWSQSVGIVLVMPEMSTHRHVVEQHSATLEAALPDRQLAVRAWLDEPSRDLRGIWFLPISHQDDLGKGRGARERHGGDGRAISALDRANGARNLGEPSATASESGPP